MMHSNSKEPFGEHQYQLNDLYPKAIDEVRKQGKVGIAHLQRTFKIHFWSAEALISQMEKDGIINKPNHAGVRTIREQPNDQ